jgi:hypothetical protein
MDDERWGTTAAYFELGLRAGIVDEDSARSWALSIVEALDAPPLDAIEVLASRNRAHLIETLRNARGVENAELAARWLLHTLHRQLVADYDVARTVARQAFQVAQSAGLEDSIGHGFNIIDDCFSLIDSGICTFDSCFAVLTDALTQAEAVPQLASV